MSGVQVRTLSGDEGDLLHLCLYRSPVSIDAAGGFMIEQVPPGHVSLVAIPKGQTFRPFGVPEIWSGELKAGSIQTLRIETRDPIVKGRLIFKDSAPPVDPERMYLSLGADMRALGISYPERPAEANTPEGLAAWNRSWPKTVIGRKITALEHEMQIVAVRPDGAFSSLPVEPGTYALYVSLPDGAVVVGAIRSGIQVAAENGPILDLGPVDVHVQTRRTLEIGSVAPDFSLPTLAGTSLTLSKLRGKYVLLDFWAPSCGPCIDEFPALRKTYEKWRSDPRFAMVGVSLDSDFKAVKACVRANHVEWTQALVAEGWDSQLCKDFGVIAIPSMFLLAPDGKVLDGGQPGGGDVSWKVDRVLGLPKPSPRPPN